MNSIESFDGCDVRLYLLIRIVCISYSNSLAHPLNLYLSGQRVTFYFKIGVTAGSDGNVYITLEPVKVMVKGRTPDVSFRAHVPAIVVADDSDPDDDDADQEPVTAEPSAPSTPLAGDGVAASVPAGPAPQRPKKKSKGKNAGTSVKRKLDRVRFDVDEREDDGVAGAAAKM